MRKTFILIATFFLLTMVACTEEQQFNIKGEITKADDKFLYFEQVALDGIKVLDSIQLKADGHFSFKHKRPDAPDFYRLRIDRNVINLGIDSTETVTIKAQWPTISTDYTVEGSLECSKIKELSLQQIALQQQIQDLITGNLLPGEIQDSIDVLIQTYKERVRTNYIYEAPRCGYAYYALFQRINGIQLFNPESSREDVRTFAAVATSWDLVYPHSIRASNLHNITMRGMRNTRKQTTSPIPEELIKEVTLFDLQLPDMKGDIRKLTDLKGKVVLLDFTVYQNQESPARNILLRELYTEYASRGLEIYQVAFDPDEHFWKTSAGNLPWICVRDIERNSALTYQVAELPTYFLIDKENGLHKRNTDIKDWQTLRTEIETLLAK